MRTLATIVAISFLLIASGSAPGQTPAQIISPAPGTKLPATTVAFTWSNGVAVDAYMFWLGTQIGTNDLLSANLLSTSVVATNLPDNGGIIFARLYSRINGVWHYTDYSYIADSPSAAEIISPVAGSQLSSGPVSFSWSSGEQATGYTLCIGSATGQCDVFQWSGTASSTTVSNLPTNGTELYVTLTSAFGSSSEDVYYTYLASGTPQVSAVAVPDHGTGLWRVFRFVYDWKIGPAPFRYVDLQFGASPDDSSACALTYDTVTGVLGFSDGSLSEAIGSQQPITNGSCTVFMNTSAVSISSTQLLLSLEIDFSYKGQQYSMFTREWSGSSQKTATPWQQIGTWKVDDESWPIIDKSPYVVADAIARQAYLTSGNDYNYWMDKYSPLGTYLHSENSYDGYIYDTPHDSEGFPIPDGPSYSIVTIAQFGLCRWARYVKGLEPPTFFLRVADKLLSLTSPDGSLKYLYAAFGENPPWTSGMAQGQTLSVFERAFALTQDPKYLAAGTLVLQHMVTPLSGSGDRSDLGDLAPSLDGYPTIEEYPNAPWAVHVLNGFEFAIIGLHDWAETTGDLEAKAYFDSTVETLENSLSYWDLGGWTNYDLDYLVAHVRDIDPAFDEYQALHIALQDTLGQITGEPRFYAYRDRWINQINAPQATVILPAGVSVSPDYGAGSSGAFQFLFRSPNGIDQMGRVTAIINTSPTSKGGCAISYDHSLNQVTLQGTDASVSGTVGTGVTLSVPECSVDLASMSVSTTTTDLQLNVTLTFSSSFAGNKSIFLAALNAANDISNSYGYVNLGAWNVCSSNCPPANLFSSRRAIPMGAVGAGSSTAVSITISNPTSTVVTIGSITTSGAPFSEVNTCSNALQAGQQCTISVSFSPVTEGAASGNVTISHNLSAGELVIPLTGNGVAAALNASPSPLVFGYSAVAQPMVQPVTVTNYTTAGIAISTIELSGDSFKESDDCQSRLLAPGTACTILVTVVPSGAGDLTGTIGIVSSSTATIWVPLTVTGVQLSLPSAATPVISLLGGTYTSAQSVMISDSTPGSVISYTIDGTQPTTSSTRYTGPLTVGSSETLKAIAFAGGHATSAVADATYVITLPAVSTPAFSPSGGTYTSAQSVTISDTTPGASIYYTTNGTSPTTGSTVYSGPITVNSSETIKAIATAPGYSQSALASATYAINLPPPTFTITGTAVTLSKGVTTGNTSTVTIQPVSGFTGSVMLSASVTTYPDGAHYLPAVSFGMSTPVSITSASAGSATLTITTTAASLAETRPGRFPWSAAGGFALALSAFLWIPARRHAWRNLIASLSLLAALIALAACGGGSGSPGGGGGGGIAGTTSGQYVVTITGTSGSLTETGTVNLTVQ